MRHFALTSTNNNVLRYKWYQYIRKLDLELQSLADYINWISPNYNILNYTPGTNSTFYTYNEMVQKGIVRKVYFYNSSISESDLKSLISSPDLQENALLIFPTKLQFHEGILNNFQPHEKGIFLSFFGELEFKPFLANSVDDDSWKDPETIWLLPDVLLVNGLEEGATRWVPIEDEQDNNKETTDDENLKGENGIDYALWRLVSLDETDSDPYILPISQLDSHSLIFNNFRIISYEETQTFGSDAKIVPFKEAFFIISLARMEDNLDSELAPVKANPKNYLYCRMAGGSPYYVLNASDFVFESKGSVNYGSSQILVLTSQPVRIAFHHNWISSYSNGYISYLRNPWRPQLTNCNGVPWVGFNEPSHHLAMIHTDTSNNNITSEEVITEHFSEVSTSNIDKTKIPVYIININEGLNINRIETKKNTRFEVNIW